MSGQVRPEPGDKGGKGMDKVDWKPGTMIYPLPAVMVSRPVPSFLPRRRLPS